jgi:hypothetical protein
MRKYEMIKIKRKEDFLGETIKLKYDRELSPIHDKRFGLINDIK